MTINFAQERRKAIRHLLPMRHDSYIRRLVKSYILDCRALEIVA